MISFKSSNSVLRFAPIVETYSLLSKDLQSLQLFEETAGAFGLQKHTEIATFCKAWNHSQIPQLFAELIPNLQSL